MPTVINHNPKIFLSARDWQWVLDLLKNPPAPNANLAAAMQRYQQAKQNEAGTFTFPDTLGDTASLSNQTQ